jgi:hypothetical protein
MVYPTFTVNTKAFNIASNYGYSPYYDIVWSFDYAISGNNSTEAGFTVFIMDNNYVLSGGNFNIDLGYSGLSSNSDQSSSLKPGISGGIVAVGFDTTGLFAVSALSGTRTIRDGINEANRILNSVSIRDKWPAYSYNTNNYNVALSSLNSSFKIVETGIKYKTIRARLGNVGRTLYVDYRNNPDEDFKSLLVKDINLNIASNTMYKVGASFATPISGNSTSKTGVIYFRNFHTEGSFLSGDATSYVSVASNTCLVSRTIKPAVAPSRAPIPTLEEIVIPIVDSNTVDSVCPTHNISYIRTTSVDSLSNITEDRYNFGYRLNVSNNTGTISANLTRNDIFNYLSLDGKFRVYKNTFCDYWTLSSAPPTSLFLSNSSFTPTISAYSATISARYI